MALFTEFEVYWSAHVVLCTWCTGLKTRHKSWSWPEQDPNSEEVIRSKVMVTVTSVFSLSDQRSRWPWTQKACLIGKLNAWTYRLQTWHWGWSWLWYDCTLILLSPGQRLRSWWPLTYKSLVDWYQENTWTYSHQIFAGRWAGLVDGPIWFEVSGKRSRSWWPLTQKFVITINMSRKSAVISGHAYLI